ncbi:MAG: 50S ribosomal protein L18 [Deltaproteobacteria bacterium]|nr:50S ribosomal protein L18 [Deltaproteobacteria bacterium]
MPVVKKIKSEKVSARLRRKVAIRKKIHGTSERPRLTVFRSAKHIYAQAIDDTLNKVVAAASDLDTEAAESFKGKNKRERAKLVGKAVAQKLLARSISAVVFDRNGFIYHGRVSAVADGAREGGLKF